MREIKKSLEIVARDERAIAPSSRSPYYPFAVGSGRGATLRDADGNEYIDFAAGAASLNTGTCHPRVTAAIKEQAEKLLCYTIGYMYEESSVELAEKLAAITPGDFPKKVAYGLSGSDAMDGAIKFARAYTGRSEIISFKTAYHGVTYGALSASAISLNMRRGLGPMLPGFHHFSYPHCAACAWREKPEDCSLACLEEIKTAFSLYLPPDEAAAVLFEPIGGDIGLVVPPARYVRALASLCREHGILFVSDEVQQGMGRTGKWFAIEHFGVTPDIIAVSKALASGMPLSALVMRAEIADSVRDPGHCLTLAANAVCCRAALETIKIIEDENLIEKSVRTGENIKAALEAMKRVLPRLGDTRGLGLTIAQEIVDESGAPDRGACAKICWRCWERGLILTFLGDNVLRIQPPLVITEKETARALEILRASIEDYEKGLIEDEVLTFARGWA
ncbi:aminotransferase class III-fold pyridoxal phosphate-dependent enzyme [Cloacibacillus sp. An23]|uniref:aminotransferase class III-fold pyridoxal phosphate-dependent enzyme n=1 Tax=Cloacibacillus sp. An23 TaxID=1965591 RepID=UPI000B395CBD|nr:aminotransferase class III-fold pyridoxal phosphate-dependent enzyme [Cloacibacillus sp. An23]OUO91371.1 aspartate aminotransferase family protein [Cloacibacillus sp. An23]